MSTFDALALMDAQAEELAVVRPIFNLRFTPRNADGEYLNDERITVSLDEVSQYSGSGSFALFMEVEEAEDPTRRDEFIQAKQALADAGMQYLTQWSEVERPRQRTRNRDSSTQRHAMWARVMFPQSAISPA